MDFLGLAVAELEFYHPDHVIKAEKSWKLIAGALQSTLGCNVEIRINMRQCGPKAKFAKVKKPLFSLFSCSRRHESQSITEHGSDPSEIYTSLSENRVIKDKSVATCFSDCGSQDLHNCCHAREAGRTIRNHDGNSLTIGMTTSYRLLPDNVPKEQDLGINCSKEEESYCRCQALSSEVIDEQPGCFSRTLKLHKKLHSSDTNVMTLSSMDSQKNLALTMPSETFSETYLGSGDHFIFCRTCKRYAKYHGDQNR